MTYLRVDMFNIESSNLKSNNSESNFWTYFSGKDINLHELYFRLLLPFPKHGKINNE